MDLQTCKYMRRQLITSLADPSPVKDAPSVHGKPPKGLVVIPAAIASKQAEARRASVAASVTQPSIEDAAKTLSDRWRAR